LQLFEPSGLDGLPTAAWTRSYRHRWHDVEAAMAWLESEGLATPTDAVNDVASSAYAIASLAEER
jgi:hypothetical protein